MKLFTCEICSKSFNHKCSMQSHLKQKHYRKKEMLNIMKKEKIINEIETVRDENKYEMMENEMKIDIVKTKRKIKLGRMMTDIAEKNDMTISFLPKDKQEATYFYKRFGQTMSEDYYSD